MLSYLQVHEIVAQNNNIIKTENGFAYSNEPVVTYIVRDAVKIEQESTHTLRLHTIYMTLLFP